MNVKSGEIYPAKFLDKNPDFDLRHVRLSFRQYETYEEYEEVKDMLYQDFDHKTGKFTINPFSFSASPDLPYIVKASDKFILENMSTSPKVEPKDFCHGIRSACRLILDNPDSFKSIFKDERPRTYIYSKTKRKWELTE